MLTPTFWKVFSGVLVLCILVQQFSLRSSSFKPRHIFGPSASTKAPASKASSHPSTDVGSWTFDWTRDGNNHGLSSGQCDAAFPDLYSEIDRAVDFWERKEITPELIDMYGGNDGGVRALIVDQQLRIIQTRGLFRQDFRHRILAVLHQLQRALTAAEYASEPLPDMEFTVIVDDKPILHPEQVGPLWAFTRLYANPRHDNLWLIPDFHFHAAPPEADAFPQMQEKSRRHDAPLSEKIAKLAWRGVEWTNPAIRKPLLNVTDGKEWADVVLMSWDKPSSVIPMDHFCKYRYTVNTEGRSWSSRMTHLLNCDSLLLVHDVEWMAHYYHLLDTGVNCVRVERNFTDLETNIKYYDQHLDEAQVIADNARSTFRERYTTPAAAACYWRKLLRAWSSVSFKPVTRDNNNTISGESDWPGPLRGISFEQFVVHDNSEDFPYKSWQKKKDKEQAEDESDNAKDDSENAANTEKQDGA